MIDRLPAVSVWPWAVPSSSSIKVPGSVAAACYKLAVDSAHRALAIEATSRMANGTERANPDLPSQATKIREA